MAPTTLILCPLEIERRAAARIAQNRAHVITTGPGPDRMRRALESLEIADSSVVILFGVAGGLRSIERAPAITQVIDGASGQSWGVPGATPDGAVLAGVAAPLLTPQAKHALRERTGADLVDTESHVFASICADRAVQWAIIRGVSDGPDDALPRRVSEWVDERGRSRPGRVALDLLRRPLLIPRVHRLGRSTGAALRAASALLDTLLESLPATIPSP